MNLQYIQKWFILFVVIGTIIGFNYYDRIKNGFKEGMMEGDPIMKKNDSFCESHRGSSGVLQESCGKLTENNCNNTSCCVWASPGKCLAGSATGPTFNSDDKGKTIELDYYYYQNKCYGKGCSN